MLQVVPSDCIVAGHLADGYGHTLNVVVAHAFVDGQSNTSLEDGLSLRAADLRVIHRSETHFLEGPATGKETVLLEDGVAIKRHRDVSRRCWGTLGGKGLGKLRPVAAECFGVQAQHVKPVHTAVV